MASLYLRMFCLVYGTVVLSDARRTAIKEEEWARPNHRVQGAYHFPYILNLKRVSEVTSRMTFFFTVKILVFSGNLCYADTDTLNLTIMVNSISIVPGMLKP